MKHLLNKKVRILADTINAPNDFGILVEIRKGRYPYIIQFDSGSKFGVSKISQVYTQVFFQPVLTNEEWEMPNQIPSFGVYKDYENAIREFPDHTIGAYTENDIEEPTFLD